MVSFLLNWNVEFLAVEFTSYRFQYNVFMSLQGC
jgi:hypothetical protein